MIALCPNPFRDINLETTKEAADILGKEGYETVICPVFAEKGDTCLPQNTEYERVENAAPKCSLAVIIGGDGTILAVARKIHDYEIPLLGINLGTKGFMAHLEKNELPLILKAARGEAKFSRRMKLDVELLRNGKIVCSDCALNDAVIHGYGECINITASFNSDIITAFSGDGVIISTPTGSTGYSMSAGGPIAEPDAENIIISPICPHALGVRSFVLAPDKKIEIKTERLHGRKAYLSVDGNSVFDLENGDILSVKRSARYTVMADLGNKSFFEIAYNKLI